MLYLTHLYIHARPAGIARDAMLSIVVSILPRMEGAEAHTTHDGMKEHEEHGMFSFRENITPLVVDQPLWAYH
jgi:hypothetical protein